MTPDHIDLLDTVNLRKTHKITIKNFGKKTETYTLSHTPAEALNSYYDGKGYPNPAIKFEEDFATVAFSQNKVKIPAGKSATITLNFAEPKDGDAKQFPIYSGYVIATPSTEGSPAVHIPYTGLKGDVAQVPMMDVQRGYPKLSQIVGSSLVPAPAGKTWDFKKEVAVILYRLGSHTPDLTASVYDDKNVFKGYLSTTNGPAYGFAGRQKNIKDGQIIQAGYIWNGEVFASRNATASATLPSGTYSVVVAAQKKLTKGVYPADYEVYTFSDVKW